MNADADKLVLIAAVTALVYLTRILGAEMFAGVKLSGRTKDFLDTSALCAIVALVVTGLTNEATREVAAISVAVITMLATRSVVWSMMAAMVFAAGWYWLVSV